MGPKIPYFGIFGLGFEKAVWNHHPQICLTANFAKKQKCLNLQPKMYDSGIFRLEFEKKKKKKKILSSLFSVPSNLSNCKILWNNENA